MSAQPRHADPVWIRARPHKKIGQPRKLQPWQASYIRRAARLRRRLTDKALMARFDICQATLHTYISRRHK